MENDFVKDRNYEGLVDCQYNQIQETLLDIKKVVDKSKNGFVHFSDIRKWIDSAKQFHFRFRSGVDIPDIAATFPKIFMASRALAELDARFNCVTAGVQQMLPHGPPAGYEGYFRNGKGELKFQHLKVVHQAPQQHQGLIAPPLEDPTEKAVEAILAEKVSYLPSFSSKTSKNLQKPPNWCPIMYLI